MRVRRRGLSLLLGVLVITVLWWAWGRATANDRRLALRSDPDVPSASAEQGSVRVLAWNIAHGRGDAEPGLLRNWRGSRPERLVRLRRIANVIRNVDADVVVLNEVDFDAGWSHGVDQAEFLADATGYPFRVEQRNFDVRIPFESWEFGNALLSRLPVEEVRRVELPAYSGLEEWLVGSKEAALVRLGTASAPLAVVPVHLSFRSEPTRRAAVAVFDSLARATTEPLILAGDFNTAPPGWPAVADTTALGELLELGWTSPRAEGPPTRDELTFPTYAPMESRDWILAEPPLRIIESRVLRDAERLSDHAPVVAVVSLGPSADSSTGPSRSSEE
ncbi:MAG: endonuclease/exonuclease/phosphatase family protein [Gemmatimonadota bacterium]